MDPTDTEIARFWKRVARSEDCWEWQAARAPFGYGITYVGGRQERAHRVSWTLFNGPIPAGMFVCHRCDNPPCVRPDHLFLGSNADNLADMAAKGRRLAGERHPWHGQNQSGEANRATRLTNAQVADIKAMGRAGYYEREIAPKFGISNGTVGMILRGQTWQAVEPSAPLPTVTRLRYQPKLSRAIAASIRARSTGRRGELTRFATEYGVSRPSIRAILDGRVYPD